MGRWRWIALLLVASCSLDEFGLMPFGSDGGLDSSILDGGDGGLVADSTTSDVVPADGADDSPVADTGVDTGTIDASQDAGPVITITGGKYTLDGADAGICSGNTGNAINFQLFNQRDASVDLIWVNYQCGEQKYSTVAPTGNVTQGTYINHVWRVRNTSDQAFLAEFILTQQKAYIVTMH